MKNGPELMGWIDIPYWIREWQIPSAGPYWHAVGWIHLQHGEYACFDTYGTPHNLLKGPSAITSHYYPIDASILPILDAWIRFFEVWEPQVERDYP